MTMRKDGESFDDQAQECPGRHTRYAATTRKARPNKCSSSRMPNRIEADGTSALQGSFVATEQMVACWAGTSVGRTRHNARDPRWAVAGEEGKKNTIEFSSSGPVTY